MLSSVLPLVLQALGNPDLSVSSVSTLKKICRECKYDLPPYATNIVAVSQVPVHAFQEYLLSLIITSVALLWFFIAYFGSFACAFQSIVTFTLTLSLFSPGGAH